MARNLPGHAFDLENRSPLLAPELNVKPGDFIVSVNGHPVSTDRPVESMLVGIEKRLVPVGINSAARRAERHLDERTN